ncbi:hypothetical protein pb186bvf_000958 [Paramecium bursaria]
MSSYTKKKIDFSELDDHFEENTYNREIDSVVQVKRNQLPEKLHEVQLSLQFSPHTASGKQKSGNTRCSFGINPMKLQFPSGGPSVRNSLQSPSTASFPLQKFKNKLLLRSSIEELSAENDISQSREEQIQTRESKIQTKNQTIDTDEEIEEDLHCQSQTSQQQEMTETEMQDWMQHIYYENQFLKQEMRKIQKQNKNYQDELIVQVQKVQSVTKLNIDLSKTLDDTQKSLQDLNQTNGLLKKKLQQYKTQSYSMTEQSQTYHQSNRNNKENYNDMNYIKEIRYLTGGSTEPQEILQYIKKSQKQMETLQNLAKMLSLVVQKCFYLDEPIDQLGKDVTIKLVDQIDNKYMENIVILAETMIKQFEQRFDNMVKQCQQINYQKQMLDQIELILKERR